MKKLLCILTFYALIFTDVKVNAQIQTLSSHPTLTANNGLTTGGVTFEIESTNLIAITGFDQAFYTSTSTVNVWYRVGGVQPSLGTSPDVSAAGGWVVHETGIPVSPSNQTDPTTFTLTNPIVISTGTPVGFFIENGPRYASYTASNQEVFTDGILTLRNGTNYGYSGIAPSLVNHPRQFVGAVHYQVLNTVCGVPQNFNFSNITSTSADLSWTNGAGNASYKVEYGQQGFAPGTGTAITQNITLPSSVETLIGLNPSSPHHVYLTEYCNSGLDSLRFGPFLFNSACGVVVAPYYEAFNNGSEPQCWVNASSDPSTAVNNFWKFSGAPGSGAAANGKTVGTYAWSDGSSPYPDSMVLVTPEVDISQLTTPFLSFEWFSNNTTYPGMNVPLAIWLHDGTSWNLLDILQGDDPEWLFVNYDLNAYANSTIKVAFVTNQSLLTAIQSQNNDILLDEIRIDDCITLGGQDGIFDICRFDNTVNLNDNIIVKPNGGGNWSFPGQPQLITQDSIFQVTYLPAGSHEVYYTERFVCYDTTVATINVFGASSSGIGGTNSVCMNAPINLYDALSGNVDIGGIWYDFTGTALTGSQPKAQSLPGEYNYTYITDNGVCPADTSIVTVSVSDTCDFLSIGEEMFTDISVYPNPATSKLNIVNPSNAPALKVEMLDMNGRIVLVEEKALNNASETQLVIDHLEKGIYTLRIYNNEGQKVFKIVKQ